MNSASRTDVEVLEERLLRDGSPFALQEIEVAGNRCRVYRNAPQNLSDIYRKATLLKNNIFVVQNGARISYADIFRRAEHLRQAFSDQFGIVDGRRIAIALEDGPDWIASFIAVTAAGAVAVLVGQRDWAATRYCCEITQCSFIIARRVDDGATSDDPDERSILLSPFMASKEIGEPPAAAPSDDADAIIAFTSGSTGLPKAAILTQRGIITGLLNMMFAGALAGAAAKRIRHEGPRRPRLSHVLLAAPLSHISGYGQVLLNLMVGGTLVFPASQHADEIMGLIAREKITSIAGATPAIADDILNASPAQYDLTSLASLSINGVSIRSRLISDIEARLPDIVVGTGYGMTETNGAVCAIAGEALKDRPRSSGRLVPAVECKITDDAGRSVPSEEHGTVWLRGAMLMRGYSGLGRRVFEQGWLNTGDIGYLAEGRHLHILDRHDEFVMTSSGRVPASAIERTISDYIGAAEAAVICGKLAATVFVPSTRSADADSLRSHLASQFGEFAYEIVTLEEFPRTLSGKIDRRGLKERARSV